MSEPLRLALFDLDHTLIPFDSSMHWIRYLIAAGELESGFDQRYLEHCRRYLDGELDAVALHQVALDTIAGRSAAAVTVLQERFAQLIEPVLPGPARNLVARHLAAGDLCCIVTATTRVGAQPFAAAFGVGHLLASDAEIRDAVFTGAVHGSLCHGTAKVDRVTAWLSDRALRWNELAHTSFYSDSVSDLPLLERVAEAVAVRPDPALRAAALARRWRIIESLADTDPAARDR